MVCVWIWMSIGRHKFLSFVIDLHLINWSEFNLFTMANSRNQYKAQFVLANDQYILFLPHWNSIQSKYFIENFIEPFEIYFFLSNNNPSGCDSKVFCAKNILIGRNLSKGRLYRTHTQPSLYFKQVNLITVIFAMHDLCLPKLITVKKWHKSCTIKYIKLQSLAHQSDLWNVCIQLFHICAWNSECFDFPHGKCTRIKL